jgi:hypothetical protein
MHPLSEVVVGEIVIAIELLILIVLKWRGPR